MSAQGVKGFVTFNVLVFDDELAAVEQRLRQMAAAGVDALIVQVRGRRKGRGLITRGGGAGQAHRAGGGALEGELPRRAA